MTIEQWIARCWQRGNSIGETIVAIHRNCGVRPTFHEVRRHFVNLSERAT